MNNKGMVQGYLVIYFLLSGGVVTGLALAYGVAKFWDLCP